MFKKNGETDVQKDIGVGGFFLPKIYQKGVATCLDEGKIDYADLTKWDFPDEFLGFILQGNLLQFVDKTYPNPRIKNEIPIWFLITCQFIIRLHQTGNYSHLCYLLNSDSIFK